MLRAHPLRKRWDRSGRDQPERQSLVTADDVVERPCRLAGEFDPADLLHQRSEHRLHLESGEPLPGAGVCAVPEAEMAGGITADVEHIGVYPLLLTAVRRRVQH